MKWRYFFSEILHGKTIGRALLFSALKEMFIQSAWLGGQYTVLELGSASASHQRAFPPQWQVKKSNYIPLLGMDYVVDGEKIFPFTDDEFDGVVMFNVLYLIENYQQCLEESLRVARQFVLFNIPLISGIARHPKDLNRFTEDKITSIIEQLKSKFPAADYRCVSFGGSFSSAISLIDPFLKFRIFKIPLYLAAITFDRLDRYIQRSCPVQYLVLITKK